MEAAASSHAPAEQPQCSSCVQAEECPNDPAAFQAQGNEVAALLNPPAGPLAQIDHVMGSVEGLRGSFDRKAKQLADFLRLLGPQADSDTAAFAALQAEMAASRDAKRGPGAQPAGPLPAASGAA